MKKNLYIHHHLGLGDHFDCNGMVRYILEKTPFDEVKVFCKDINLSLVKEMYEDNKNIEVISLKSNPDLYGQFDSNEYSQVKMIIDENTVSASSLSEILEYGEKHDTVLLVIGHGFYKSVKGKNCWEIFYDQVGIPYEIRKDYFYLKRDTEQEKNLLQRKNPNGEPFIFIHDDKSRGFEINKTYLSNDELLVIENDVSENIFNFIGVIRKAQEVHCMESSFKTLVDIYCDQDKLFFHDFRGHPLGFQSNKNWKVINYE